MIGNFFINTKDFSISLPQIIKKVGFIADVLAGGYKADGTDFDDLLAEHKEAVSYILNDIEDELRIINEVLYPEATDTESTNNQRFHIVEQ